MAAVLVPVEMAAAARAGQVIIESEHVQVATGKDERYITLLSGVEDPPSGHKTGSKGCALGSPTAAGKGGTSSCSRRAGSSSRPAKTPSRLVAAQRHTKRTHVATLLF